MQVTIKIECDNDAFQTDPAAEVARILENLQSEIQRLGLNSKLIRDANGNLVGEMEVEA